MNSYSESVMNHRQTPSMSSSFILANEVSENIHHLPKAKTKAKLKNQQLSK